MSEVEMNILFLSQDEKFPDRGDSVPKVSQGWGTILKQAPHTRGLLEEKRGAFRCGFITLLLGTTDGTLGELV